MLERTLLSASLTAIASILMTLAQPYLRNSPAHRGIDFIPGQKTVIDCLSMHRDIPKHGWWLPGPFWA